MMRRRELIEKCFAAAVLLGGCGRDSGSQPPKRINIDFASWVLDARRFADQIKLLEGISRFEFTVAPPLLESELEPLASRWPTEIPRPLLDFWTKGSRHFHCQYVWTPPPGKSARLKAIFPRDKYIYGGARFEPAQEIFPGNSGVVPGDEDMKEAIGDNAYRLWCETAVILHVGNGDLIALDQTADPVDPPVVYLSHDDDSSAVIAPSFSFFLKSWAELCFVGPEIWLLKYWLDHTTGFINPTTHMTQELQDLLGSRTA